METATCTSYPALQPNPDISGVGVLSSFVATAYLTFLCCLAKYFILEYYERSAIAKSARAHRWIFALDATILSFSDQQLITGVSILIAGFSQLRSGVSTYHWQIVGNLAWFSTMTHLLTLTMLEDKLRSNPALKVLRLTAMAVLVVMLICVMSTFGYVLNKPAMPLSLPAWCLYHPSTAWANLDLTAVHTFSNFTDVSGEPTFFIPSQHGDYYNWIYVLFTICVILFGYISRAIRLTKTYSFPLKPGQQPWNYIESRLEKLSKVYSTGKSSIGHILARIARDVLLAFYVLIIAGRDLYGSRLWELTWLSIAIIWGTIRLFVTRNHISKAPDDKISYKIDSKELTGIFSQENNWGFGQVVAVALLALPVVSFLDAFLHPPTQAPLPTSATATTGNVSSTRPTENHLIRQEIQSKAWYKNFRIMWYLVSLLIGADCLMILPVKGPGSLNDQQYLSENASRNRDRYLNSTNAGILVKEYVEWIGCLFAASWIIVFLAVNVTLPKLGRLRGFLSVKIAGSMSIGWALLTLFSLAVAFVSNAWCLSRIAFIWGAPGQVYTY